MIISAIAKKFSLYKIAQSRTVNYGIELQCHTYSIVIVQHQPDELEGQGM